MTNISEMFSLLNRYTGETTTERISNADRYSALSEAVSSSKQKMKGDMSNMTYPINFIPGIHYYKIDKANYNVLAAANIRVSEYDTTGARIDVPYTRSSADKISVDIAQERYNDTYALDRFDGEMYLVLNTRGHNNSRNILSECEILDGITSTANDDVITIDADGVKKNSVRLQWEPTTGDPTPIDLSDGLRFAITSQDLSDYTDSSLVVFYVKPRDIPGMTSFSITLGSSDSDYLLLTATSPYQEEDFIEDDWNRIVINLGSAVTVGTPDLADISIVNVIANYEYDGEVVTSFMSVDEISICKPSKLNFHYLSYSVGHNQAGDEIQTFTAETDVPYFAGQYDNFKYPVARLAASYILFDLRRYDDAAVQEAEAEKKINEVINLIPSQHTRETKTFRPAGLNFSRRYRSIRRGL